MDRHTERVNRLLALWLDLVRAVGKADGSATRPWECGDADVTRIWERITEPDNQRALEEWLFQSVDGQPAEWARQALQSCRERAK